MITLFTNWLLISVAGLWASLLHWGIGITAIVLLLAAAIFTDSIPVIGKFLAPLRKDLLWAAFGVALLLIGQFIGTHDANNRCVAKQVVIEKIVTKAVDKTKKPASKSAKDPFDDPDN
jgi:hypothetical protein